MVQVFLIHNLYNYKRFELLELKIMDYNLGKNLQYGG